jgi:hypothetical protein
MSDQISFIAQSSSALSKLAFILETHPDVLSPDSSGLRVSRRVQMRESDRVAGLVKESYEDSLVLLTEV